MKTTLSILLIFTSFIASCQEKQDAVLKEKVTSSLAIIEGKVIKQESFWGSDGYIYTENTIEVYKTVSKDFDQDFASVITCGGRIGDDFSDCTHSLMLNIENYGIFFLNETKFPTPEKSTSFYGVSSNQSGFLKFLQETDDYIAYSRNFKAVKVESELYPMLEKLTGTKISHKKENGFKSADEIKAEKKSQVSEECIEFKFDLQTPDPLNPLSNIIDVSIRTTGAGKYISKPTFDVKYNSDAIGSNAYSNGVISLQDLGISGDENYQSIIEDITTDKVRVQIDATNLEEPELFFISDEFTQLVRLQVTLPSLDDPELLLDEAAIQSLSKYYDVDDNIEKLFDCVRVVGDLASFGGCEGPVILDMYTTPLTILDDLVEGYPEGIVTGGTQMVLTILGQCFGEAPTVGEVPWDSDVYFLNANEEIAEWFNPRDSDYLYWQDEAIGVYIPSRNSLNEVAGTGHVRVETGEGEVISPSELHIDFSMANTGVGSGVDEVAVPVSLTNHLVLYEPASTDSPGVAAESILYYNYSIEFEQYPGAVDAFERAMYQWKCLYSNINFTRVSAQDIFDLELTDQNLATIGFSDFGPIDENGSGLKAKTQTIKTLCLENETRREAYFRRWDMNFNSNITWHTGENMPALASTTWDLETVALHEIGHLHGLNHVRNSSDIMFHDVESGEYKRDLADSEGSIYGGFYAMSSSQARIIDGLGLTPPTGGATCQHPAMEDNYCLIDGIERFVSSSEINLFPIPVKDQLYFSLSEKSSMINVIQIINPLGQIVLEEYLTSRSGSIDLSNLNASSYQVNFILSDNNRISKKIIKS